MIKISTEQKDRKTILRITGAIDAAGSAELDKALRSGITDAVLDFEHVTHLTSAGLKCMLTALKRNISLSVINVSPAIASVFQTNGYNNIVRYEVNTSLPDPHYVPEFSDKSFKSRLQAKFRQGLGDRVIVNYVDRDYTWRDVEICSQIIADDLAALGVVKGSHVAISGTNSFNWIAAFFAVQKLGAVAVLMNYFLSPDEVIAQSQIGGIEFICVGKIPGHADLKEFCDQITGPGSMIKKTYVIHDRVD